MTRACSFVTSVCRCIYTFCAPPCRFFLFGSLGRQRFLHLASSSFHSLPFANIPSPCISCLHTACKKSGPSFFDRCRGHFVAEGDGYDFTEKQTVDFRPRDQDRLAVCPRHDSGLWRSFLCDLYLFRCASDMRWVIWKRYCDVGCECHSCCSIFLGAV